VYTAPFACFYYSYSLIKKVTLKKKAGISTILMGVLGVYNKSLGDFLKKPVLFLPFMLSSLVPLVLLSLNIGLIAGEEGINYVYGNRAVLILSQEGQIKVFSALALTGVISAVVISYFDIMGISLCAGLSKGLSDSFAKAKSKWSNMLVTNLSLMFLAIVFIFPALLILEFSLGGSLYLMYILFAIIVFGYISMYSRVVTVIESLYGFDAIKRGLIFGFRNFFHSIGVYLIIVLTLLAYSWLFIINTGLHLLVNMSLIIPWINLFTTLSYKSFKR